MVNSEVLLINNNNGEGQKLDEPGLNIRQCTMGRADNGTGRAEKNRPVFSSIVNTVKSMLRVHSVRGVYTVRPRRKMCTGK